MLGAPSYNSNGPLTLKAGWSVASMQAGASCARKAMAPSPWLLIATTESGSIRPTMVVGSNGSIWFTDPTYGADGNYEGFKVEREQEKHNVYRVDPQNGAVTVVVDDFTQPNGICFSPDEKKLYIIDSSSPAGEPLISARSMLTSPPAR
jgi:gluconolactonase